MIFSDKSLYQDQSKYRSSCRVASKFLEKLIGALPRVPCRSPVHIPTAFQDVCSAPSCRFSVHAGDAAPLSAVPCHARVSPAGSVPRWRGAGCSEIPASFWNEHVVWLNGSPAGMKQNQNDGGNGLPRHIRGQLKHKTVCIPLSDPKHHPGEHLVPGDLLLLRQSVQN